MRLHIKDFQRFEKQIILKKIGLAGQKKISSAKVLIIGVGGLGCPLITYLASSGIAKIGIADDDIVELGNLNRQTLFDLSDINKYKVDRAKIKINRINKKIKVKSFKTKVSQKNIKSIIKNFEIICDGTDNFETRYLINDQCKKDKKILISAAISKFEGQIFKFNFKKNGSCFRCFMPEKPEQENNCETEGIFPPVAGILGSLQASEVLKSILDFKDELTDQILIFDSLKNNFRKVKISINPLCLNKCKK